jgi:hypothetical protein
VLYELELPALRVLYEPELVRLPVLRELASLRLPVLALALRVLYELELRVVALPLVVRVPAVRPSALRVAAVLRLP